MTTMAALRRVETVTGGNRRCAVISLFEYVEGVFQLNVWGIVLVLALLGAIGSRAARK